MKDPTTKDPKHVVIKVTVNDADRCLFVRFDRASQSVVRVDEYRVVYRPWMSSAPMHIKAAIAAARTKLETTPETATGELP